MKQKRTLRLVSGALAVSMALTALPTAAFAAIPIKYRGGGG